MSTSLQNFPSKVNNKIRSLWLRYRDVEIADGYAKGLFIRTGRGNLEYALGTNELPVQKDLVSLLKPGSVFYDIGANIGFFTIIAAKYVGENGKVYAFEPLPDNVKAIRHNVALNNFSQVDVIPKAVSNHFGTEKFLVAEFSGGSSLESGDMPPDFVNEIYVDVVTIDDFLETEKTSPPDVVKIDVEGAEIGVLEGMSETITKIHPVVIYEIDDHDQKNYDRKQQECERFLSIHGYTIQKLADGYPGNAWIVGHYIAHPKTPA